MAKRHNWSRGYGWMVCDDCGCRYRTGNLHREYEQPDGSRTPIAEICVPGLAAENVEPPTVGNEVI